VPALDRLWKYHLDSNHNTERQPDPGTDAPVDPAGGTPRHGAERLARSSKPSGLVGCLPVTRDSAAVTANLVR
jgi:hypothetical protein